MCASSISFAQDITGVGDFKIGMSLEEFLDLPLIKNKNKKDKSGMRNAFIDENELLQTTADSKVVSLDRVYSSDVIKFEFKAPMGVPSGPSGDSYPVSTRFYKGKLAQIAVLNAATFLQILKDKYGKPVVVDKVKEVTCQNQFGAMSKKLDGVSRNIWGRGKKITAEIVFTFADCGKVSTTEYYVVENTLGNAMVRSENDGRKVFEAEEAKSKINASKL